MVAPVQTNDAVVIADFQTTGSMNVTQFGVNDAPFDNTSARTVVVNAAPNGIGEGILMANNASGTRWHAGGASFATADFTNAIIIGGHRHKTGGDNGENFAPGGYGMVIEDGSGRLRAWKYGGLDEIRDNDSMLTRYTSVNAASTFNGNGFTENGAFDLTDIVRAGYFTGANGSPGSRGSIVLQMFYVIVGVTVTRGDTADPATFFNYKEEADNAGAYDFEIVEVIGGALFRGVMPFTFGNNDALEHRFVTSGQSLGWIQEVNDLNALINNGGNGERYGMIVENNDLGITLNIGSNFHFDMSFGSISSFDRKWYLRIIPNGNTSEVCNFNSVAFTNLGNDATRVTHNTILAAPAIFTGCAFSGGDPLNVNDATLTTCTFSNPSATHLIVIDDTHDVTNSSFATDTATDIAILIDQSGGATIDLDGLTFSGFTDKIEIDPAITTGTYTINLLNGTSVLDAEVVRDAGVTVNIVSAPVTTTITAVETDGTVIPDARVLLEAAAGGPLAIGTDIISGLTDINGEIADTRSLASNQPVTGRIRKSSAPGDLFQTASIIGTISNVNGLNVTVVMVTDE